MPNAPAPEKIRVSYLEFRQTYAKLTEIAAATGRPITEHIRAATHEYAEAYKDAKLITMIVNPDSGRTRTVFVNRE